MPKWRVAASVAILWLIVLALSAVAQRPAAPRPAAADPSDPAKPKGCLVTLIEEAEVPSQEAGVIQSLNVREGMEVAKGDVLAQIDDAQSRAALKVAEAKVTVAEKEAGNDVSIRYAQAASAVADAEYKKAQETNLRVPGTVPNIELQRLWLKTRETALQIENAQHEFSVVILKKDVSKAERDLAAEDVQRRQIKSPLDGIVVKRYSHNGEWLKPGDPVIRVVRADRLRVEAFVDASRLSPADVDKQPVTVTVPMPHGDPMTFEGKIVFVNPIVEPGPQFLVWAEVVNRQDRDGHWLLRPGMNADMEIKLKK
jgi:multidrug efflux pump subunit AcrA (membrane-fusion protein)